MRSIQKGLMTTGIGIAANVLLAMVKIVTGILGHSYALIADGIESTTDVVSSLVVWTGLKISSIPADEDHPYGHGKAESIAAFVVSLALLLAALLIAVQSLREIITPHHAPAWFTLPVLGLVVVIKETLYRVVSKVGRELTSTAMSGDAWHHRSDALTSGAAFVGIAIAQAGGEGYETADDWAALLACAVIGFNGFRLARAALNEIMDAALPREVQEKVRRLAAAVEGVAQIPECRLRKSGLGLLVDITVWVDGRLSVRRGHEIAEAVADQLKRCRLGIVNVMVHIEPAPSP